MAKRAPLIQYSLKMLRPWVIFILLALNIFAIRNFILLSGDMLTGGDASAQAFPQPVYLPVRLPETSTTQEHNAAGRIGSDFAQVYFPAQQISRLQDGYDHSKTLDPWGRPSRYAPFVILLCSGTLCRLDYGYACYLNMWLQMLLFYVISYWAFSSLELKGFFLPGALFANLILFLTPVGLSWFERGQFSLYVAGSFTLLMMGLITKKPGLVALAALLAFVKWTSFPAIFVIFAAYLFSSSGSRDLRIRLMNVALFTLVTLALLLGAILFVRGTGVFLSGLAAQELHDNPTGLSLLKYVPPLIVKLLPLILVALGYLHVRNNKTGFVHFVPYTIGVTAITILYPTRANDYSMPTLLGFIPLMLFWSRQYALPGNAAAEMIMSSYFLFVVIASFSTKIANSFLITVLIYLVFSLVFIVSPSVFIKSGLQPGHPQVNEQENM